MTIEFTTEFIFGAIGVLLSLFEAYFPKWKDWYADKSSQVKQQINLGLAFVIVAGAYALSYFGVYEIFTPDWNGVIDAVVSFVAVMIANATTYVSLKHVYKKGE